MADTVTAGRQASTNQIPTEAEMLERARALVPVLRARAAACEENRSVLPETVADFEAAGFYKMLQPAAYGGYEMHPLTMYKVVMIVASACPSSGWCLSIVCIHNWEMAMMDPKAAHDVWADAPNTRISSSYAPFGKIERVEGGFKVSGSWPFSSGCDHCTWALLGGFVPGDHPDYRAFLIPRTDYEIVDNWHVLGLKGTGSKIVKVTDAFVPEHRTHHMADSYTMSEVGRKTFTAENYRFPFGFVFVHCLAVSVLGMADGALEAFVEEMTERCNTMDGQKTREDPFVRQRVASASATIRGLHQNLEKNFADIEALLDSGTPIPIPLRVAMKWDATVIAQKSLEATQLLFKATGGRGLQLSSPIQRFFRDAHAASNHLALNPDKGALNAGYVAMGGENADYII